MFDTELFIAEVERENCIWKTDCKEYLDKNAKLNAWLNICNRVYDCWETFTRDEQDLKIEELKKKWKHLRDNYAREINETRKSVCNDTKNTKKYAYTDVLNFLHPVLKKRRTTRNIKVKMPIARRFVAADTVKNEVIEKESRDITDTSEAELTMAKVLPKRETDKMTSFQSSLLHLMKNPPMNKNSEEFNPDKAFLLSFLPYLQKMDENQKIDLKIQFLQSVKYILTSKQPSKKPSNT